MKILNDIHSGEPLSPSDTRFALEQSLSLVGNFYSRLTRERRGCVLRGIHPSLQHMESEEFSSTEHLFGREAVRQIKERADELKTLRLVKT